MRDLAVIILLPFLVYFSFKRAYIAVGLWLWTSAFKINDLLYGFASSITYNKFFAIITMMSYFLDKNKPKFNMDKLSLLILIFFIWTTISTMFSNVVSTVVWSRWEILLKIVMFYFFAIAIMHKKKHIDFLIWVLVLSIGVLAAKEGVKFIVSGGSHRFGGIKGVVGDNNFFAVMILVVLSLNLYLVSQVRNKKIKLALFWGIVFIVLGLISTYSRAGFIGLIILSLFFLKSSKRKFTWLILFIGIIFSAKTILPDEWFGRMNTVEHAEEDGSFMHRVVVWKMCTVIAIQNPFLGEGFKANEYLPLWHKYYDYFHILDFIETPEPHYNETIRAAHSMYFQVLAEHGFVGLFLFLLILLSAYIKVGFIKSRAKANNMDDWVFNILDKIRLAIIVYCITGSTVASAYFDFFFAVLAMIYTLDHHVVSKNKRDIDLIK